MWLQILFVLFLSEIGSSIRQKDCPDGLRRGEYLVVFENKCYYFYTNLRRERDTAEEICETHGGKLVTIDSKLKNEFIWKQLNFTYSFGSYVWIGLNDEGKEGDYKWEDGSDMPFSNFESKTGTKTPFYDLTKYDQDCVLLDATNGKWRDVRCGDSFIDLERDAFVCEYPPKSTDTIPQPPATREDCPFLIPRDKYLTVFGNKCYYFHVTARLDFHMAQRYCKGHGGNLASVKTPEVQSYIWKTLRSTLHATDNIWIGLSDEKDEGKFVWRDGSPVIFQRFEQNIGLGIMDYFTDCVAMDSHSGKWHEFQCKDFKYFVCEFSSFSNFRVSKG